ncbi:MAG: SPOR domain-containing protein [Desulfovermiculus sp.]|nr:SPOR domain-containing protein [Desulfovermiculus sp.]
MSSQKAPAGKKAVQSGKASQKKKKTAKGKLIQFKLTWSGLISWGVFAFVVVAWAFILGVLVGRGYHPEAFLPLVAEYMPGQSGQQQGEDKDQASVLSAQDLGFYDTLQQEERRKTDEPVRTQPQVKSDQDSYAEPDPNVQSQGQAYVYEYQVGAFKRRSQAEVLQQGLRKQGFAAQVVRSTVQGTAWYRVLVQYTGQTTEEEAFTSRLRQAGVKNFFLRSKKAK